MKNLKNKITNMVKNRRAASMMEFFVITLVVLLIGSGVFLLAGVLKNGIGTAKTSSTTLTENVSKNSSGYTSDTNFADK